jgi:hypothetical protein
LGGDVDPAAAAEQAISVENDLPLVRLVKTGEQPRQGRLAAPRFPENPDPITRNGEVGIHGEVLEPFLHVHTNFHFRVSPDLPRMMLAPAPTEVGRGASHGRFSRSTFYFSN